MPDKESDLLSKPRRIKPTKNYQIILSKDGEAESTFKVDQNYTQKAWWEIGKWILGFLGFLSIPVVGVGIYVSCSLSGLEYILLFIIGFLVVCFLVLWFLHSSRRSNSFVSSTLGFGHGVGFLDACIGLIEKILQVLVT